MNDQDYQDLDNILFCASDDELKMIKGMINDKLKRVTRTKN